MPGRRHDLGRAVVSVAALLLASVVTMLKAPSAAAWTDSTQVPASRNVVSNRISIAGMSPSNFSGTVGVDLGLGQSAQDILNGTTYFPCGHPTETYLGACFNGNVGYYKYLSFGPNGSGLTPQLAFTNADNALNHGWANKTLEVGLEFYPGGGAYDPWTQTIGGVRIGIRPPLQFQPQSIGFDSAGNGPNLGVIRFPAAGQPGVGHIEGTLISATPVPTNSVRVDLFQEEDPYLWPTTSTGYPEGAFSTSRNKSTAWNGGYLFNGRYHAIVYDSRPDPDVIMHAYVQVNGTTTINLDLDAVCLGLDECWYQSGNPPSVTGRFHPVIPARILDTRAAPFGPIPANRAAGPITQGDGANSDPNPWNRLASALNHEVKVTGVGGIPATGVSAVLVNVTAVGPTTNSDIRIYPKPPRTNFYDDQSSFGSPPNASNLNVVPGQVVPNLVVAKVGAGGKVRVYVGSGGTNLLMDVVGWFDTGAMGFPAGSALVGAPTPTRILDTRAAPFGPIGPFSSPFLGNQVRTVPVAGQGGVPAGATAVIMNVTAFGPSEASHVTIWPTGQTRPNASFLNFSAGQTVPNLVVVKLGAGGQVDAVVNNGSTHLIADVVGWFVDAAPTGTFTPLNQPTRVLDTRGAPFGPIGLSGPFEAGIPRDVQIAGVLGIPNGALAVVMNVTVTGPTAPSHLTVWPAGRAQPNASNLNFLAGQTVPNLVVVSVGDLGRVSALNNSGSTAVIFDVVGYVT